MASLVSDRLLASCFLLQSSLHGLCSPFRTLLTCLAFVSSISLNLIWVKRRFPFSADHRFFLQSRSLIKFVLLKRCFFCSSNGIGHQSNATVCFAQALSSVAVVLCSMCPNAKVSFAQTQSSVLLKHSGFLLEHGDQLNCSFASSQKPPVGCEQALQLYVVLKLCLYSLERLQLYTRTFVRT